MSALRAVFWLVIMALIVVVVQCVIVEKKSESEIEILNGGVANE